MDEKFIMVITLSLFALVLLTSCSGITAQLIPAEPDTVKIGVIAPLTGNFGLFGERIQKGVELAKEELNAKGGINSKQIELVYEDTKCEPAQTMTALQKLKNLDNVVGIIGPFCGSPTQIAAEFCSTNNLIGIVPNNNYGKLSDKYFSVMSVVEVEDKLLAEYAYNELGLRKISTLYYDNYFGLLHKEKFHECFEELGGKIVVEESFQATETDFRTSLSKIGQESEGILIVYSKPGEIMNQIAELGLELQILGQWGIENPDTLKVAGKNAEGTVYTYPEITVTDEFKNKFEEHYGEIPTISSSSAYDALNILAQLFNDCQNFDTACAVDKMMTLHYEGASGTIDFNPETWDVGKTYVMKTIRDGEFVLIE